MIELREKIEVEVQSLTALIKEAHGKMRKYWQNRATAMMAGFFNIGLLTSDEYFAAIEHFIAVACEEN